MTHRTKPKSRPPMSNGPRAAPLPPANSNGNSSNSSSNFEKQNNANSNRKLYDNHTNHGNHTDSSIGSDEARSRTTSISRQDVSSSLTSFTDSLTGRDGTTVADPGVSSTSVSGPKDCVLLTSHRLVQIQVTHSLLLSLFCLSTDTNCCRAHHHIIRTNRVMQ